MDTYEKAASKGGLITVSNALLINHLSGADTRSRTRDLLITSQSVHTLLTFARLCYDALRNYKHGLFLLCGYAGFL